MIYFYFRLEFKKNIFGRIEFLLLFSTLIDLFLATPFFCYTWGQKKKKNRDMLLFSFRGILRNFFRLFFHISPIFVFFFYHLYMKNNNMRRMIYFYFRLEFKKNIFGRIEFLLLFSTLIDLFLATPFFCYTWGQKKKKNRDMLLFSFRGILRNFFRLFFHISPISFVHFFYQFIIYTWRIIIRRE